MARVGGEAIGLASYERQLRILKSLRPESELSSEQLRRQVLEQMAKQLLLTQLARRDGLDADPAVKAAIAAQKEAVRKELTDSIAAAQAQLEQLDMAAEQKILIERLLEKRRAGLKSKERQKQLDELVELARQGVELELNVAAALGAKP